jgi:50S ribosomal protein L16 3-hydroxylase
MAMTRYQSALGGLSVTRFMRDYWQRKPLLIRQALPMNPAPIDWPQMAALARRDDTESRLISHSAGQWSLRHGPFKQLPTATRKRWTLLVQGVDLYSDPVHELLGRFRFLSDARLDDVMVSIASDGGGVGPHWDSYDVFLLQAQGQRRWRIGATGYPDSLPQCLPELPLKIIREPQFSQEHLLEAGDMLYLPPGWAHDGVAVGACTTLSIGFRAPSRDEFLQAWFADRSDRQATDPARYGDAGEAVTRTPGKIPVRLDQQLQQWISASQPSAAEIEDFIGRFLSEPKPLVWFQARPGRLRLASFVRQATRAGLVLDRQTRMLFRKQQLYINGERADCAADRLIQSFVNERRISGVKAAEALRDLKTSTCLHQWWSNGWIHCNKSVQKSQPC